MAKEEHQESLVLPTHRLWCLDRVGWERVQSPGAFPICSGTWTLPIILLGWMVLLWGSCFQREVLWCHFPWILALSAAQEQGPGMSLQPSAELSLE